MKKLLYFAFAAMLCCGFVACSDDDEGGVGDASELVGAWSLYKEVFVEDGETYIDDEYYYGETVWVFNADGTGYIAEDGYIDERCSYRLSGNKLFLSEDGEEWSITVKKLTADELVLYGEEYDEEYDCMIQATAYFERYEE